MTLFDRAAVAVLVVFTLSACGSDSAGDGGPVLSPEAAAGREVSRTNGCAACHGSDGEGGVGPAFEGLYGATVTLTDGSTVIADEAYLAEAIRDPDATRVDGYALSMPDNDLSDEQIASVIAFIRELSPEASSP